MITENQPTSQSIDLLRRQLSDQLAALDKSTIVVITDPKGIITYANPKFCEISGYSKDEIIGKTHSLINSGVHDRHFFKDMWGTITRGQVWRGEICNRAKCGDLYWVDTTIVPFLENTTQRVRSFVAIRYDITAKKKTEAALEQERLRMLESEKMASIGVLTAGIAHELGNPLGAIRGRLEMLEDMLNEGENFQKEFFQTSLHKMIDGVDRMSKIIRSLKSYARDGSQDPKQPFNLCQLVSDIVEVSREKCAKKGVKVLLDTDEEDIQVLGRETEIGQVVVNLFNNAFDAIASMDDPLITLNIEKTESHCVLQVCDNGPGVPDELVGRIFDPFFTTKDVGQGTGLGLSICRSIVESHGGNLKYERHGDQTLFQVELPLGES